MSLEAILMDAIARTSCRACILKRYTDLYKISESGIYHRQATSAEENSFDTGVLYRIADFPILENIPIQDYSQDFLLSTGRIEISTDSLNGLIIVDRNTGLWEINKDSESAKVTEYDDSLCGIYADKRVTLYKLAEEYTGVDWTGCKAYVAAIATKRRNLCVLVEAQGEELILWLRRVETKRDIRFTHDGKQCRLDGYKDEDHTYRRIAMSKLAMPCKDKIPVQKSDDSQTEDCQQNREPFELTADKMVEDGEIQIISSENPYEEAVSGAADAVLMDDKDQELQDFDKDVEAAEQESKIKAKRNIPQPTPLGFDYQPVIDNCIAMPDRRKPVSNDDVLRELRALRDTIKACASRMYHVASMNASSGMDKAAITEYVDMLSKLVHK